MHKKKVALLIALLAVSLTLLVGCNQKQEVSGVFHGAPSGDFEKTVTAGEQIIMPKGASGHAVGFNKDDFKIVPLAEVTKDCCGAPIAIGGGIGLLGLGIGTYSIISSCNGNENDFDWEVLESDLVNGPVRVYFSPDFWFDAFPCPVTPPVPLTVMIVSPAGPVTVTKGDSVNMVVSVTGEHQLELTLVAPVSSPGDVFKQVVTPPVQVSHSFTLDIQGTGFLTAYVRDTVTGQTADDRRAIVVSPARTTEGETEGETPPQTGTVPNVVGMTQSDAAIALQSNCLAVGVLTEAYSATVAAGRVISSNPGAGVSLTCGTQVALVLSKGPAPTTIFSLTVSSPVDGSLVVGKATVIGHVTGPNPVNIVVVPPDALNIYRVEGAIPPYDLNHEFPLTIAGTGLFTVRVTDLVTHEVLEAKRAVTVQI